ncbi:MAG: flagellar motor switch phosphatase FliY [Clostridiaceae bacterium]|jgi:flagellar motor switch protein FliN/FliY|nr:flagellar motor switch phosphatase FliY [Clostridiaceae bacterium]
MGDMLSQAEIDALLSGAITSSDDTDNAETVTAVLSEEEVDAIGEIGNIGMGTSATTLYMLLGHKVIITTPKVTVTTWDELTRQYPEPYVAVKVTYTNGLMGDNLLIMKEPDVKVITDLMMGGSGRIQEDSELTDFHLSAISEAMNQMVGSSATSLSSMFQKRVDISPPESQLIHFSEDLDKIRFDKSEQVVIVAFSLIVGDLIDSSIMQIIPIDFAREMVRSLLESQEMEAEAINKEPEMPAVRPAVRQPEETIIPQQQAYNPQENVYSNAYQMPNMTPPVSQQPPVSHQPAVNVRPVQFQSFDSGDLALEAQNIGLLMDVPLQITVELGRTSRKIKEILEFGQGSIIELDKLSGEPVDILVNGKNIASGEVVVIDESFGVRITDIIHPSKRI